MYQGTTTEFNNIISGDGRTFHARMTCGDEIISGFKSVKLTGQANEDTNTISIGGAVSSFIEVNMDKPDVMITGKEFTLEFGLTVSEEVEWVPMGVFAPQKPKESDGVITFTAYDRMVSKLSGAYFTDITSYPVDGKAILQEIADETGIIIANLDELPDGIMVSMRTQIGDEGTTTSNPFDGYTHRETVKYLAQMYGKFATFNRTGELEFRWYAESGFTTRRLYAEPESSELVYTLQKITCTAGENTLTTGSGTTGISIENPVMTQEILNSVFTEIGGMQYLPVTCSFFGDIRLDLGDIITVQGRTGLEVKIPVMSLSVDFDGGIITDVGSYGNTEAEENQTKGPIATALDRVYTDLFLVREVLANKISTKTLEADYATIKQLEAVRAKIDKITASEVTVEYLEANYAQINLANVAVESVQDLFVNVGLIKDATIVKGKITGYLDAVSINAESITGGTLDAAEIDVINLNCANLTVGQINGHQIASGVIDMEKLDKTLSETIVQTEEDVLKALEEAGLATDTANSALNTANNVKSSSIYKVDVLYALSTSTTTAPTSGWQTTAPEWVSGKYMWQKTVTTYGDGKQGESKPTCISGATGQSGKDGEDGTNGKDGTSVMIKSTAITYQSSSSGTTPPTGTWSNTIPTVSAGQYLWTKTVVTYSDNTTTTSYSIGRNGVNGAKGDKGDTGATGKGVKSIVEQYYLSTSNTTQTGGSWSVTCPTWASGKYIWTRSYITWSDSTISTTTPVLANGINSANSTANSAQEAANAAQITADDKNAVFYQTSTPSTTGRKTNDIWFDTDNGNLMYYWNGSAWTAQTFGTNAITASSITAAKIASSAVTAAKIASSSVTTDKLNALSVTAAKIAAGAITTDKLAANAVTAAKIAAGAVSATHIASAAITTDKLSAGAVTAEILASDSVKADHIVAGTITATEIASATITGSKIKSATITATNLASNSVTAAKIASGAITTDKLAANAITADKIDVESLETISAKIGGFDIGSTYLANNTTELGTIDKSVYVGIDGISCGTGFVAHNNGACSIKGEITAKGGITLKGGKWENHITFVEDGISATFTASGWGYLTNNVGGTTKIEGVKFKTPIYSDKLCTGKLSISNRAICADATVTYTDGILTTTNEGHLEVLAFDDAGVANFISDVIATDSSGNSVSLANTLKMISFSTSISGIAAAGHVSKSFTFNLNGGSIRAAIPIINMNGYLNVTAKLTSATNTSVTFRIDNAGNAATTSGYLIVYVFYS